jgi:hypothetical protein
MAKRTSPHTPTAARVTPEQMRAAIPKLQRRIQELQSVEVNAIQERGDPALEALEHKVDDVLVEIFGTGTVEYNRFRVGSLDTASINIGLGSRASSGS